MESRHQVSRRLFRSRKDRKIAGVAGGLADYMSVDPSLIRLAWVAAGIFTGPLAVVMYILWTWIVPEAPSSS